MTNQWFRTTEEVEEEEEEEEEKTLRGAFQTGSQEHETDEDKGQEIQKAGVSITLEIELSDKSCFEMWRNYTL